MDKKCSNRLKPQATRPSKPVEVLLMTKSDEGVWKSSCKPTDNPSFLASFGNIVKKLLSSRVESCIRYTAMDFNTKSISNKIS